MVSTNLNKNRDFNVPIINMELTGKKIHNLASSKGITPLEIKQYCRLGSVQAVYKWFSGKSIPSIDNLGIISYIFETTIDDIVVFEQNQQTCL